jgi:hypothetical protein
LSARWLPTKPAPPVIRIFIFFLSPTATNIKA